MNQNEKEIQSLISTLQTLRNIKAPDTLASRLRFRLPSRIPQGSFTPFFTLRLALCLLLFLIVSGATIVKASFTTRPGQILYPVKQIVEEIIHSPSEKDIVNTPTPTPSPTQTPTPTPSPQAVKQRSAPATLTPTPVQTSQNQNTIVQQDSAPSPSGTSVSVQTELPLINSAVSLSVGSPNQTHESQPEAENQILPDVLPNLDISVDLNEKPLLNLSL